MKLFLHFLKFIGLIDCVHDYGVWEEDLVTLYKADGSKVPNYRTGYQYRKCKKCGFMDKRWT